MNGNGPTCLCRTLECQRTSGSSSLHPHTLRAVKGITPHLVWGWCLRLAGEMFQYFIVTILGFATRDGEANVSTSMFRFQWILQDDSPTKGSLFQTLKCDALRKALEEMSTVHSWKKTPHTLNGCILLFVIRNEKQNANVTAIGGFM